MARVLLDISDGGLRMTLKAILEAAGHAITTDCPVVVIAEDPLAAVAHAHALKVPALVLATAVGIRAAVAAMRQGVYGYIFLPLQPGETEIMVERALSDGTRMPAEPPPLATVEETESRLIFETLRRCNNNHTEAARALGIGRNTLWRKLKRLHQRTPRTMGA